MSENSTPEQRTEAPTGRRIEQLRRDGAIYTSTDVNQLVSLTVGFMMLTVIAGWIFSDMQRVLVHCYSAIVRARGIDAQQAQQEIIATFSMVGPDVALMVVVVAASASLSVMLQTKWNMKAKWVQFKWNMINPISGLKRIFSIQGFVTVAKAILKLCIILPVGYFALKKFAPQMVGLVHMSMDQTMDFVADGVSYLFWKIFGVLLAFAIFDYFWGNFQWLKTNRMTKEEVKDEKKSTEGDEETRRKIINKGLTRIMQRIKNSVPKADVVVTNPTHISVALQYDRTAMGAPKVIAKGKGFLALRIREIAREAGVPVIERKPLARALFASTEVGSEIPHELFRAVAEVLAYVYRLKNPYGHRPQAGR